MTIMLGGCAEGEFDLDSALDTGFKKLFSGRRSPQQDILLAVSADDPDIRRESAARVSASKKFDAEWAIKSYVAIATLESDPQTRCVAIRALARTGDPRATETCLKILNYEKLPPQQIWPPVALVRWDATESLARLSENGQVPEEYRSQVHQSLLDRLRSDTDRHVRIAAAHGLGFYPTEESVVALIRTLGDRDFAVVHECETALVRLTGHTHNADAAAWETWLEENRTALFAHAGSIPDSRRAPYENGWQKFTYETGDLMRWLWPGSKEE